MVGLTGTPSSNGLIDLWAEISILDMGERLGRYITRLRDAYFMPDKHGPQTVFSYKPRPGTEEGIYRLISDITISMKNTDYLKLPELVIKEIPVQLSDKEMEHYQTMKREMVISLKDREIDALKDYGSMEYIIKHSYEEIYALECKMESSKIAVATVMPVTPNTKSSETKAEAVQTMGAQQSIERSQVYYRKEKAVNRLSYCCSKNKTGFFPDDFSRNTAHRR